MASLEEERSAVLVCVAMVIVTLVVRIVKGSVHLILLVIAWEWSISGGHEKERLSRVCVLMRWIDEVETVVVGIWAAGSAYQTETPSTLRTEATTTFSINRPPNITFYS